MRKHSPNTEKIGLDQIKGFHGGYWRYDFIDFHYLYNHYFPTNELFSVLQKELPVLIGNYPSTQRVIAGLISRWKNEDYFNENNIIVANGSSELIRILNGVVSKMTVPIPTFNEYVQLPEEKLNIYLLSEEARFQIDANKLAKSIKHSNSDFAVICNPNNPVGNLTSKTDIEAILKTGVNLIVDEAFIDCSGQEYSCEDMVPLYKNLIVIKSLTKVAGTAGLRLGYMLTTNEDITEKVKRALPIWNVNSITERFIELFPKFFKDFHASLIKGKADREYLQRRLTEISCLEPYESHANFVFCKTKISAKKIGNYLYKYHNIVIRDSLNQANLKSDNFIRLGVRPRTDVDKLIPGLIKISEWL